MTESTDTIALPGESAAVDSAPLARSTHAGLLARPGRWALAWFAALLAVTLVVRLADPTDWLGSDDLIYFTAAERVLSGQQLSYPSHHSARTSVVLPVALSMALFGRTAEAVALPMLVASTLCVVLVAVLGRLLWGWPEGLCAASVVAVLPYFRVLSTTAYPDVHACLWATLAVLLALVAARYVAARPDRPLPVRLCALACGAAVGLAVSAKLFSGVVVVGVLAVIWTHLPPGMSPSAPKRWRTYVTRLSWVALGSLLMFLADSLYYAWAADDFWYKLRSLAATQSTDSVFASARYGTLEETARLGWDRLTLLLRPSVSGWGMLALGFWPAALLVLVRDRPGRGIAVWAIATYLLVAFMPISFKNGIHPFPAFHGRHILTACVPFALCFARVACHWRQLAAGAKGHRLAPSAVRAARITRGWPVVLLAIVLASYVEPGAARSFRDRRTRRMARAVRQVVASADWDDQGHIVMTPMMYLRFRVLFPTDLRSRLRVVADERAPTWWRERDDTARSRHVPLPSPSEAYLLVTPSQLAGRLEWWEYEVGLPLDGLDAWKSAADRAPLVRIVETDNGTIHPTPPSRNDAKTVLLLLGKEPVGLAAQPDE